MLLTQKNNPILLHCFSAFLSLSFLLSTLSAIACPVVVRKFVPTSAAVCKSQSPTFMVLPKFPAILPNAPKAPPKNNLLNTLSLSTSFELSLS